MTSGAPWSVKGIDPKAREVAKDLARRSGMTLGEWLNHMILEDESPEDVFSESQLAARPARNYYETPRAPDAGPARYETVEHPGDELTRVVRALDRLTERIETSETHTGLAIGGVEHSVREAVARIEAAERDHVAVAARFEGAVSEVADAQARLADRLRRMEAEAAGPRSAEALRSLEQALGKVANHLYDGENRTRSMIEAVEARVGRIESGDLEAAVDPVRLIDAVVEKVGDRLAAAEARTATALEGLRDSFAALDRRLNLVEQDGSPDIGQRFEQLAANLTARVEASRVDVAERLRTASDGRFDRIEKTLSEVAQQVRAAEQGSAQAIERMGREVMTMADTLNQRVGAVEQRGAEAIEQVGGEMARIAEAMESRLGRADAAHAQALEKLGGEITRITERLAERIGASERRSAQAIDDVIEQVSRSNERVSQRHERASDELAERIRQSEERTARLLEEARAKIEQGLADSQRRLDEAAARPAAPSPAFPALAPDPFAELGPAEPDTLSADTPKPAPDAFSAYAAFAAPPVSAEFATAPGFKAFGGDQAFPSAAPVPAFDAEDFAAADAFAPLDEAEEDGFASEAFASAPAEQAEPESEPEFEMAEKPLALDAEPLPEVEALNSALDILDAVKARQAQAAEPERPPQTVPAFQRMAGAPSEPAVTASLETEHPAPPVWTLDQEEPETPSEEAWRAAIQDPAPGAADPLSALEALEGAADRESFEITTPAGQADAGPAPDQARPLTTREVVEQARAAARAAAHNNDGKRGKLKVEKPSHEGVGLFSGFGLRPKRRAGSKLQIALMLTGGAAALGVATAGFVLDGKPDGAPPQRVADALALERGASAPQAAVALAPAAIGETLTSAPADTGQNLAGLYTEALSGVEAGQPGAVDALRKVANLGYPRAQFHLAKLYESGEAGLKKDLAEARRWTERAARGGDREAMHNFALQQFFGDGGSKDAMGAAEWFRRAAELGLVDSQFNLARLYEDGVGVTRNLAEAYKWYLIAAKSGDPDSKASAARVRGELSADARSVTERAAASFRSALPGALGAAAQPAGAAGEDQASVVTAQRALSRLGYYQGPSDGVPSPALRMAISAYQRDQGLEADGGLDATTVSRLSVFTR